MERLRLPCGCLLTIHEGKAGDRPDGIRSLILRVWHTRCNWAQYPKGMLFAAEEPYERAGWINDVLIAMLRGEPANEIADFIRDHGWNGERGDAS